MIVRPRLIALVSILALVAPATAGEIVGYVPNDPTSQATYDRFTSGFPDAPVVNTSPLFVASGLDVSGVGWRVSGNWGLTLISPSYFVTAAHVGNYSPGEQVRFMGTDGVIRSYSVATDMSGAVVQTRLTTTFTNPNTGQVQTLPSDILVVKLAAPIATADLITPLAVGSGNAPVGTNLLAYGQNPAYGTGTRHFGTNTLDAIGLTSFDGFASEATVVAAYDYTRTRPGDIALIGGDSGGPLLTRQGNMGVMLGTHYGVEGDLSDPTSPYLSASTYLPFYLDQLNAIVTADGQSLTIVPVAEPRAVGLVAVVVGLAIVRRRGVTCRGGAVDLS